MKTKRKVFFYVLLILFFLIGPAVVAFSFGYRFNFANRALERTGGIFLKTNTSKISIFLDGDLIKETNFLSGNSLLSEIRPGSYLIRIEREGFYPWSKRVQVSPEVVTEFREIFLVPNLLLSSTSTPDEVALITSQVPSREPNRKISLDKKNNLVQKTQTGDKILFKNIYSFKIFGNSIYFVDRNGFLATASLDSSDVEILGRPGFYMKDGAQMDFYQSTRRDLVIRDPSGGLFWWNGQGGLKVLGGGIQKIGFDSAGDKMLALKENQILLVWLRDNRLQPFQKKGTVETLISSETPIQDAHWFYEDEAHIFAKTKDAIFISEIDARGGQNKITIYEGKSDQILTTPDIPDRFFYRKGKIWFTMKF